MSSQEMKANLTHMAMYHLAIINMMVHMARSKLQGRTVHLLRIRVNTADITRQSQAIDAWLFRSDEFVEYGLYLR
jgi:hypothetical protein